jgi:hypothetical protein
MQLDYEQRVPGISILSELVCQWFDDLYLPESTVFRPSFSPQELEALSAFNTYFADQEESLPDPRNGIRNWLGDKIWSGIMHEATRTLAALNAEPRISE